MMMMMMMMMIIIIIIPTYQITLKNYGKNCNSTISLCITLKTTGKITLLHAILATCSNFMKHIPRIAVLVDIAVDWHRDEICTICW